jgi:hypothetical protein
MTPAAIENKGSIEKRLDQMIWTPRYRLQLAHYVEHEAH